jgi:hypothetical protein
MGKKKLVSRNGIYQFLSSKKWYSESELLEGVAKEAHRGVAQLGSALLWGSRGRGFKSRRSDKMKASQ